MYVFIRSGVERNRCCWFFYVHMLQFCFLFTIYFVIKFSLNVSLLLIYTRDFVTITFKERKRHWQPDSTAACYLSSCLSKGVYKNLSEGKLTKLVDKKLSQASGSGHITEIRAFECMTLFHARCQAMCIFSAHVNMWEHSNRRKAANVHLSFTTYTELKWQCVVHDQNDKKHHTNALTLRNLWTGRHSRIWRLCSLGKAWGIRAKQSEYICNENTNEFSAYVLKNSSEKCVSRLNWYTSTDW